MELVKPQQNLTCSSFSILQEVYSKVAMNVELSERVGGCFAAKLMCGAYMFQEQERAKKLQYEELINPDYGSTSRMYYTFEPELVSLHIESFQLTESTVSNWIS